MAVALVLALVATFVAQNAVTALMTSTPSAKPPNCRGKSSAPWSKCVKTNAATAAPRSTSEPDRRWDDLIRLRLPKLKKAKPLEASLERPSHDVPVVLFAVVTVVLFAWLLAMTTGALPTVRLSPGYNWLIIPLPLAYVLLAATGLGPWVGAAPSAAGTDTATMDVVSFGIFSGLVIQGTAFVVMGKLGPHSHLTRVMYAPCAIYVMALSYYATKVIGTPLVATDAFGLRLSPLRLVYWMCSTAIQCVLWSQIHHIQCKPGGLEADLPLPVGAILLDFIMLLTGLLGSLRWPHNGLALNVLLTSISTAAFYALLVVGTRPLKEAAEYYSAVAGAPRNEKPGRSPEASRAFLGAASNPKRSPRAAQFSAARVYIFVTWHLFPLAWLLGAFGFLSSSSREMLFMGFDILAKLLPVSVYMQLLST